MVKIKILKPTLGKDIGEIVDASFPGGDIQEYIDNGYIELVKETFIKVEDAPVEDGDLPMQTEGFVDLEGEDGKIITAKERQAAADEVVIKSLLEDYNGVNFKGIHTEWDDIKDTVLEGKISFDVWQKYWDRKRITKPGIIFDDDAILKKRHFAIDIHNGKLFYGLLMSKNVINFRKEEGDDGKMITTPDGTKQIKVNCIMSGPGKFNEINKAFKKENSIDFFDIPSALPQRWELKKLKKFIDGKTEKVNGVELLKSISNIYEKYISIRSREWYSIYSIWDIGTYMYPIFEAYPLIENRGIPGTAKSKSMDVSSFITFNGGQLMVNPSESTLFRETEEVRGTGYIDEAEKLWVFNKATKQMEGDTRTELINASYTKSAKVPRQEKIGNKFITKWYSPYSPKQLSSINGLYGATEQRAITRICTKSSNDDKRGETEPLEDINLPIWSEIRDKCYRYALENEKEIRKIYISFDSSCGLRRRDLQIWKPLLSIAKHISEDVYQNILTYAINFSEIRLDDMIPKESFDYMCLKALRNSVLSSPGKIYVDAIKKNYLAVKGVEVNSGDVYLNRTISQHLDKLGFKEFRKRDKVASFFNIDITLFNEIVVPICPELVAIVVIGVGNVDDKERERESLSKTVFGVDNIYNIYNIPTPSTLSTFKGINDKKSGVDKVAINGDNTKKSEKDGKL